VTRAYLVENEGDYEASGLLSLALLRQNRGKEAIPFIERAARQSPILRDWIMPYEEMLKEAKKAK